MPFESCLVLITTALRILLCTIRLSGLLLDFSRRLTSRTSEPKHPRSAPCQHSADIWRILGDDGDYVMWMKKEDYERECVWEMATGAIIDHSVRMDQIGNRRYAYTEISRHNAGSYLAYEPNL